MRASPVGIEKRLIIQRGGRKIDRLDYTTHTEERKTDSRFRIDSSRINKEFGPPVRAKSGDRAAAPKPSRAGKSDSGGGGRQRVKRRRRRQFASSPHRGSPAVQRGGRRRFVRRPWQWQRTRTATTSEQLRCTGLDEPRSQPQPPTHVRFPRMWPRQTRCPRMHPRARCGLCCVQYPSACLELR